MPAPMPSPPTNQRPANVQQQQAQPKTAPVSVDQDRDDRQPIIARVRDNNRIGGKSGGQTITFDVKKVDDAWHAFMDKTDLGSAPHPGAAWRLVDREMRNAKHALTTDADEIAAKDAAANAPRQNDGNQIYHGYRKAALAAQALAEQSHGARERERFASMFGVTASDLADAIALIRANKPKP